jgi:phage anti-repressor protein
MCRANRILDNKTTCNIYLWCTDKKTNLILDYINQNTQGFIKNKVYIYNTEKRLIEKHKIEITNLTNNLINYDDNLINYIKQFNIIPSTFIDTFFKKFKIGGELNFDIKDNDAGEYLGISLITIRKRLSNAYSKSKKFIENVDFIKIKSNKTSSVTYMINYQCFEKLAMSGDSVKSDSVRMYFIKLREFLVKNQQLIY